MTVDQAIPVLVALGACGLYYWHMCIFPWMFHLYFLLPRGKFYLLLVLIVAIRVGLLYLPAFVLPFLGLDKPTAQNIALAAMVWVFLVRPIRFRYLYGYWPLFPDREGNRQNFNQHYRDKGVFLKEFKMASKAHRHLLVAWAITYNRMDLVGEIIDEKMWSATRKLITLAQTHDISNIDIEGGLWY